MKESFRVNELNYMDLNVYYCGMEDCRPGHSDGPAVKDHYLIHYVMGGKGIFQSQSKTYHLEKGQGFVIFPNIIAYYQADENEPWDYAWVGFQSLHAESYLKQANLTVENPIFQYDRDNYITDCFLQMIETNKMRKGREIRLLGYQYQFLSKLVEEADENELTDDKKRQESYIEKALKFIQMNYSRKISITEISNYIGLDRSYLCSLFKEYLNVSPKEYLNNFRINKACELMYNNTLSIGDISRSVGYEDPLLFSKLFKNVRGQSPTEYRLASRETVYKKGSI